jgi:hypothetical protein
MRGERLFERLSAMGVSAQSAVPGVYAWGVTVAPAAWSRGASMLAKGASIVALLMLGAGVVYEHRWGVRARAASLWGFVLASAAVWSLAPLGLNALRIDAPRGVAGMFGWGLFAFVSAAPVLPAGFDREGSADDSGLIPRRTLPSGNATYIALGSLIGVVLQGVGWTVANPERALFVRLITLGAGLSVIGAATQLALVRHAPRTVPSRSRRFRRAMVPMVALGILGLAGLLFAVRD